MEYGFLSLLPPLIAIFMALKTKQTLLSLFVGVWLGATIINGWNPLVGFAKSFTDFVVPSMADPWNAGMLILVSIAGGFMYILRVSGASKAFAQSATKKIKTRKHAQIVTWLSAFAFSYTEPCLILGTIMRPITEKMKVSRAKLAYILDSMGCSLSSFSPICSYGPFITSLIATQLLTLGIGDNPWGIYFQMFPFNLYALFNMLTVLLVILTGLDVGHMYIAEKRAVETGELLAKEDKPIVADYEEDIPDGYKLTLKNFLIPMLSLFITIFVVIFWTGDIAANGFVGSFTKSNIVLSVICGFMAGSIGAAVVAVSTGLLDFNTAVDKWTEGVIQLMIIPLILILAWSISGVATAMNVGGYLSEVAKNLSVPGIIPALIFIMSAVISFATGTSWGTWSILMPIAIPMAHNLGLSIPLMVGAVISGGLFGDQVSPISDTTILSSTASGCDLIVHVKTQLPYISIVAIGAFTAYLIAGIARTPVIVNFVITFAVVFAGLKILSSMAKSKFKNAGGKAKA